MAKRIPFKIPGEDHKGTTSSGKLPLMNEDNLIQLARSLDHTPGIVMLADARGSITFINKGLAALSGFKYEEMAGLPMTSFWRQTPEMTRQMMAKLYSDRMWQGEIQHIKKSGQDFWELASISVIIDREGLITGYFKLGQDISDRKAEQELQGIPEKGFKEILDLINAGYIETDLRGVIIYADERAADIYRRSLKELRNLPFKDYMVHDEAERISRIFKDIFRSSSSREIINYNLIGKDGSIVSCKSMVKLLKDSAGQPAGFGCVISDITETRKIEAALKESEESYRKLINMAPYSISINKASDRSYVLVNNAFLQRMEFSREAVIGRNADELGIYAGEEDRERLVNAFRAQGRLDDFETRFKTGSGAITEVLLSARPVIFQGEPCNLYISTNIDALKKAQRELMESEESSRRIIETSPYSMVITRLSDFRYVQVNDAFCSRTGYTREETIGKTSLEQNIYADWSALDPVWNALIRDGKVVSIEMQHRAKDGRILDSLVSISPIRFKGEDCLLTISADLTERKRSERELEQYRLHLEEMVKERTRELENAQNELVKREKLSVLGQLTATVSHELRNPLGVIRSSAYYIQKKFGDQDEKIEKHLKRIEEQVQVCDTIVDDLLEYTRGRNLSIVIEDLSPRLNELAVHIQDTKAIHIDVQLPPSLPAVPHDPEKIRRVLVNVLDNAIQAVRERQDHNAVENAGYRPKITIAADAKNGHVVIEVADNGSGMDPETVERAFEPLFTTRSRGTGIGLAIVKKIVAEHNGQVSIESRPGEGTKISILLPTKTAQAS